MRIIVVSPAGPPLAQFIYGCGVILMVLIAGIVMWRSK